MSWIARVDGERRRSRVNFLTPNADVLETRTLLADGITVTPGPAIAAVVGIPVSNAVMAAYTVTDPSGQPGTQWRGLVNFGDGHIDGPLIPLEKGADFEFIDSHTYNAPGTYTITVMIAVPGSQKPNDNTVTTQVTVTSEAPMPPPPPPPPPPNPILVGSGLNRRVRGNKVFHGEVARFSEPQTRAQEFQALIDWGDRSAPTPGLIHAQRRGRFVVLGSHRYVAPGVYNVAVKIQDLFGREIVTESVVRAVK
jgi:hypothetical protein